MLVMNGSLLSRERQRWQAILLARRDSAKKESYVWPHMLPGGKAMLFDIVTGGDQATAELAAMRLDDGKVVRLGVSGTKPTLCVHGAHSLLNLGGTVSAARLRRQELSASQVPP